MKQYHIRSPVKLVKLSKIEFILKRCHRTENSLIIVWYISHIQALHSVTSNPAVKSAVFSVHQCVSTGREKNVFSFFFKAIGDMESDMFYFHEYYSTCRHKIYINKGLNILLIIIVHTQNSIMDSAMLFSWSFCSKYPMLMYILYQIDSSPIVNVNERRFNNVLLLFKGWTLFQKVTVY